MVYPCLHFTSNHEDLKTYMPYPNSIRRIEDQVVLIRKVRIELRGRFIEELHHNAFSRTNGEDALASKFCNYMMMDLYTKNALWLYWKRGGNEEVLTEEELSDPEETYDDVEHEVAKIFRVETDIFHFETPICKAFNEFNYLFKMDTDFLTNDIPGFKTYKEYKDD
ncbi:hypothetical protein Tco_0655860 [Tanacetum coccineum]|uniref:Uncharacterized protein n=1 Tax=Tanacetum coccineum TaxID=301880 RepID=A0ABQ4X757_9ASTR